MKTIQSLFVFSNVHFPQNYVSHFIHRVMTANGETEMWKYTGSTSIIDTRRPTYEDRGITSVNILDLLSLIISNLDVETQALTIEPLNRVKTLTEIARYTAALHDTRLDFTCVPVKLRARVEDVRTRLNEWQECFYV